jgi:hypothetical protein
MSTERPTDFEQLAREQADGSGLGDLWHLVRRTGKWWLVPVLVALLLVGLLVLLSGSAAAPFIYTLF